MSKKAGAGSSPDIRLLLYELRKDLDRLLSHAIDDAEEMEPLLDRVLETANRWLVLELGWPVERACLLAVDKDGRHVLASSGMNSGEREVSRTVVERTLEEARMIASCAVPNDPEFNPAESLVRSGTGSFLSIPLRDSGGLAGVLYLDSRERTLIGPAARRAATELAETLAAYLDTIHRHHRSVRRASAARAAARFDGFVANAPAMHRVVESIGFFCGLTVPILILGESGVGKEWVARALHSGRNQRLPFIPLDVAARPASLIEGELFGHEKGTFTGASADRAGIFVAAGKGTVFLDEIGELSIDHQVKLLRVLQEGTVRRLGSKREERVEARIVMATNRPLAKDLMAGRFRADLYERVRPHVIEVPPLRERLEDLEELTTVSLERAEQRLGLETTPALDPGCIEILKSWQWPGNIRELHGFVERLVARTIARVIPRSLCRSELELWMRERPDVAKSKAIVSGQGLKADIRRYEISLIRRALMVHGGVKTAAARSLRIPEATLRSRMKALGIDLRAKTGVAGD